MTTKEKPRSALTVLREQIPPRALTSSEVRHVLERQATRLLHLSEVLGPPVPIHAIASALPRVQVERVPNLPDSGRAHWNGQTWVLFIDANEVGVRRRFSLAHELAHVVWHPAIDHALPDTTRAAAYDRIERAAEYFAACLLMPRVWIKRAYYSEGIQDVPSLSHLFDVSRVAMQIRLEQLGLVIPTVTQSAKEAA